jgi:hypothetical protein
MQPPRRCQPIISVVSREIIGTATGGNITRPDYDMMLLKRTQYIIECQDGPDIPEAYLDRVIEVEDDFHGALLPLGRRYYKPERELTGVTNSLVALHDLISIYREAALPVPKLYIEIQGTLEQRRSELDPGWSKGRQR